MQLESFLERSADRHPEKAAIICGEQSVTYGQLERAANRFAHSLIECGIERGDRVAIYMGNAVEAVVAMFGILKAGAVFLMVNPTTKEEKLHFILENCRARALVLPEQKQRAVSAALASLPHLETLFVDGGSEVSPQVAGRDNRWRGIVRSLFHACHDGSLPDSPPRKRAIDIDLAALVYTSGSTGRPKGVMLTHLNMVSASTSITTYLENRPSDIVLNVLPLAFDYGLYQVIMSCQFGGTVVLERSFAYPHAVMRRLVEHRATGLPLVPTMAAMLLQMDLSSYDLSSLRYVTNTGAALPTDHIRQLRKTLPHVAIYSMYGLTECKRVAYLPPDQIDIRTDSVGKAMPNTETYLVDEQGNRLGPGQVGELVVRGANVMKGYWERPEATAEVLKPGPLPGEFVLHTGDLFRCDDEGYLYFVGRKDDMLKSRGEKVSPREVENVLCRHPAVAEAAVVGLPDPILGHAVCATVSLRPGAEADPRSLLRHCAAHLEDFMIPQRIDIRDVMPKTSNGKVDKRRILSELQESVSREPSGTTN